MRCCQRPLELLGTSNNVTIGLIPETDPAQTASMEEFVTELDQVRRIRQTQGSFPVSIDGVFKP